MRHLRRNSRLNIQQSFVEGSRPALVANSRVGIPGRIFLHRAAEKELDKREHGGCGWITEKGSAQQRSRMVENSSVSGRTYALHSERIFWISTQLVLCLGLC